MNVVVIISTLFVIGSVIGYILEVLYRRIFSRKKWMNPGLLFGPYLPIYGIGTLMLYGISNINFMIDNYIINIILKILLIGISMTLIEFIFGIISLKLLKIRLWDYSKHKGNVLGVICPLYSFYWLVIGCLYYFVFNPVLVDAINFVSDDPIYSYFIGVVIGMLIVDFAYSIHLLTKLIKLKNIGIIKFDEFRGLLRKKR